MLNEAAKNYLKSLIYKSDAEIINCMIPLGGIYWNDEITDFQVIHDLPDDARKDIYRLIQIRYNLWDGEELSQSDMRFLQAALALVPDCPLFKRLQPTEAILRAQKGAQGELDNIHTFMAERSKKAELTRNVDGTQSIKWRLK